MQKLVRNFIFASSVMMMYPQSASAEFSGWSYWTDLGHGLEFRGKCEEKWDHSGGNWKLEFRNNNSRELKFGYEIENGYGGQGVRLSPGETEGTWSNYTNHPCDEGINISWKENKYL